VKKPISTDNILAEVVMSLRRHWIFLEQILQQYSKPLSAPKVTINSVCEIWGASPSVPVIRLCLVWRDT